MFCMYTHFLKQWMFYRSIEDCIRQLAMDPSWNVARGKNRRGEGSWYMSTQAAAMCEEIGEEVFTSEDNSVYHLGCDGFSKYAFSNKSTSEYKHACIILDQC